MSETSSAPSDELRAPAPDALTPRWLIAILAPGLVVFVLPMIDLITRNESFFHGDLAAGRVIVVAAVVTTGAGFALWAARRTAIGGFLFACYLSVAPAWIVYSMVNGSKSSWPFVALAVLIVAGGIVLTVLASPKVWSAIALVGSVVVVMGVVTAGIDASSVSRTEPPDVAAALAGPDRPLLDPEVPGRADGGDLPNVYHIILDELQTEQFEVALGRSDPSAFDGFTFYDDARATYGRTVMSIADLFSPEPYGFDVAPEDFVHAALFERGSFIQQLRRAGYDTSAYVFSRDLYGQGTPFDHLDLFDEAVATDPGRDDSDLATSLWLYANLPLRASQALLSERHLDQFTGGVVLPNDAQPQSVAVFDTFLNREEQLDATGRYTLVHLILPHKPYTMTADCVQDPDRRTDPVEQATCGVNLLEAMMTRLKELDRFESSTIVIQGDHGGSLERSGDELTFVDGDQYTERWSAGRSKPALLVKPAGVGPSSPLARSSYPALLSDVMPTVFASSGLTALATDPTRTSLLAAELPDRSRRSYYFYEMRPSDDLPDGSMTRFEIEADGAIVRDRVIDVP